MQAIVTKYVGPSNTRGSRIKATAKAGSVTVGYDHALNIDGNHRAAAEALRAKMKWTEESGGYFRGMTLHDGQLPNGDYCWVMVPANSEVRNA